MAKRSNIDLIGRWIFFIALPWLLLALPRLLLWCLRVMQGKPAHQLHPGEEPGFYKSQRWRTARIKCFERNIQQNGTLTCELCFRTKADGIESFHCHHKRSRSKWPELALEQSNLVATCDDCNMGMSNRYEDLKLNQCRRKAA